MRCSGVFIVRYIVHLQPWLDTWTVCGPDDLSLCQGLLLERLQQRDHGRCLHMLLRCLFALISDSLVGLKFAVLTQSTGLTLLVPRIAPCPRSDRGCPCEAHTGGCRARASGRMRRRPRKGPGTAATRVSDYFTRSHGCFRYGDLPSGPCLAWG